MAEEKACTLVRGEGRKQHDGTWGVDMMLFDIHAVLWGSRGF